MDSKLADYHRRAMVSGDGDQIFLSFFDYSQEWVNYLKAGAVEGLDLANMRTYGVCRTNCRDFPGSWGLAIYLSEYSTIISRCWSPLWIFFLILPLYKDPFLNVFRLLLCFLFLFQGRFHRSCFFLIGLEYGFVHLRCYRAMEFFRHAGIVNSVEGRSFEHHTSSL